MKTRWGAVVAAGALAWALALPAAAQGAGEKPGKPKAAAGQPADARPAGGGRRGGGFQMYRQAAEKLGLNADQKAKVDRILTDSRAEMKKIREGAGTPQEKRPKVQALRKATRQKIDAVLTPPQREKLKTMMAEAAAKRRAAQQGAGAKPDAKPAKKNGKA